jgi:dolichyl-phosphate-mannose--protein O-mannosyl transferase
MLLFGVNPFGWRVIGTLFGIAMLPFIYAFAKKFFRESWISVLVTILFAFDFMHFTQTRIATIDVYVTFFIILMYYFMYQYTRLSFYDTPLWKTFIPLGLCGFSMGLGIASKWTGVYAGVGLAIIFFWNLGKRFNEYRYAKTDPEGISGDIVHAEVIQTFRSKAVKTLAFCIVFFIIIPAIIYLLSYIPFVDSQGRGLIARLLKNQESMLHYHSTVDATHPYSSWWYQWPTMYRPIWYYSGHISDKISEGISAFGNPLVWWAGIPAFIYMIYLAVKKKDKKALFLIIAYLAQYLPWVLVTRITFIYHYFPSVPFVTLMVGYAMYQIVMDKPKRKKLAIAYTVAAVILFIMFYPVLSGQPVNKNYVSYFLRWFESWVLVT